MPTTVRGARGAVRGIVVAAGLCACARAPVVTGAQSPASPPLADRAPRTADLPARRQDYDLVIRNGRVLDGAGNPWILADVAVKDGRFVKLGRIAGRGRTEIDARG